MKNSVNTNRRRLLLGIFSLPFAEAVGASVLTPRGSEGPFYPTPGMRFDDVDNDLVKIKGVVEAAGGEIVRLQGRVLDQQGMPVKSAQVETGNAMSMDVICTGVIRVDNRAIAGFRVSVST